jgi:hypothetical protein
MTRDIPISGVALLGLGCGLRQKFGALRHLFCHARPQLPPHIATHLTSMDRGRRAIKKPGRDAQSGDSDEATVRVLRSFRLFIIPFAFFSGLENSPSDFVYLISYIHPDKTTYTISVSSNA